MELFNGMAFNGLEANHSKLQATIDELNTLHEGDKWMTVPGLTMPSEVVLTKNNEKGYEIMPYGIIMVLFSNERTGEIKSFPASMFV